MTRLMNRVTTVVQMKVIPHSCRVNRETSDNIESEDELMSCYYKLF